jgi:hypothetical protein
MTGDTNRVRAVSLVTILILSILGGAGAFSIPATAEQGSISFDAASYTDGDTVTVTVDDADLSTTEEYVVNIESDTESQENILSEDIKDGVKKITTNHVVADETGDNKITESDFVYSNNLDSSGGISKVSRNADGTVDLELVSDSDEDDSIGYTRGETVILSHKSESYFEGNIEVNNSDNNGVLHINNGDSITGSYSDESADEERLTTASIEKETVDEDPEPLTLGPITEFSINDLAGTSLTHTESVVEVPFSEDVAKAGGEAGALTLADNNAVAVGGASRVSRSSSDELSSEPPEFVSAADGARSQPATANTTANTTDDQPATRPAGATESMVLKARSMADLRAC